MRWLKAHWLPVVVHSGALLPLVRMAWSYGRGLYFIDPVRQTTAITGRTALLLLLLSLSCTPFVTLTGFREVLRVRRALGLYAFLYAGLHFLIFAGWDYRFDLELLGPALLYQRFVVVGLAAFLLLVPLALTSTQGWQRRMGKKWQWLQRLVYLAGTLAVAHLLWLKKDFREAWGYAVVLAVLLLMRVSPVRRVIVRARERLVGRLKRPRLAVEPGRRA